MADKSSFDSLINQMESVADRSKLVGGAFTKVGQAQQNLIDSTHKLRSEWESYGKLTTTSIDKMKRHIVELKKEEKAMAAFKAEMQKIIAQQATFTERIVMASKSMATMGGGVRTVIDGLSGLAGSTASVGFSFSNLSDAAAKYNKSMFEISRTQSIFGKGMGDTSKVLQMVSKDTTMSKQRFLELSNTLLKGFVGIKPGLMEVGKILKTWGDQMGYDYESAKELFDMQSKYPPLYDQIKMGLDKISKLKKDGTDSKEDLQDIEDMKNKTLALAIATGQSAEGIEAIAKSFRNVSKSESDLMSLEKERQKVTQNLQDLQLEFAKEFEPVLLNILKASKSVLGTLNDFKEPVATVAVLGFGFAKLTTGSLKAGSAMKYMKSLFAGVKTAATGLYAAVGGLPLLLAATAVAAATSYSILKKNRKELQEVNKLTVSQREIQAHIKSLTSDQQTNYNNILRKKYESLGADEAINLTEEQRQEIQKESLDTVVKQSNSVFRTNALYEEAKVKNEKRLDILNKINDALGISISLEQQYGGLGKDALREQMEIAKEKVEIQKETIEKAKVSAEEALKSNHINIEVDIDDMSGTMRKVREEAKKLNLDVTSMESLLNNLLTEEAKQRTNIGNVIRTSNEYLKGEVTQSDNINSLVEQRLQMERQVMESAQFGMGASIDMMQKQVDLAYALIEVYRDQDKQLKANLLTEHNIGESQVKSIQNATTIAQAEEQINKIAGKDDDARFDLLNYYKEYQGLVTKDLQQQQKIYDLTKNVREGYLDALAAMSTGAGEFEKIIGTQDTGITQLMKVVKDVTGEYKLNTMKGGGEQDKRLTEKGVGSTITGAYGQGGVGVTFEGAQQQEAKNNRIYKYKESIDIAKKIQRSTVGEANVPGVANYVMPDVEARVRTNNTARFAPNRDKTGALNVKIRNSSAGTGDASAINRGSGVRLGANAIRNSSGGIASGGAMPSSAEVIHNAGIEGGGTARVVVELAAGLQEQMREVHDMMLEVISGIR